MRKRTDGASLRIAMVVADAGIPVLGDKGAAVHVRAMAKSLTALGHEVVVVAARRGKQGHNTFDIPVIQPNLGIDERAIVGLGGRDGDQAAELGEIERLLLNRAIEEELITLHAAQPFDAIYERLSLWSYAGIAAGRTLTIPVLLEANARLVREQQRYRSLSLESLARGVERHVLATADALLAVSAPLADDLIAAGARPERTFVLPNGVDTSAFHQEHDGRAMRKIWGVSDDEIVVGFVGSLKPWHGVDHLIAALERLKDRAYRLVVVGDGPQRERCERLASRLPMPARFTGPLPHDDVPAAIAAFDIAVAPYAAEADSYFSPLKVFEYAAMGRAIVAAAGGQVAALFPPESVVLYQPGDVGQLAEKIAELAADRDRRSELGSAAAAYVLDRHTWEHNATRVVELIGRLRHGEEFTWAA